ncbi:MAG: LysM peptidoglycan-binding domain-containing protein [Chloroflexi bacterium]|nr:LysM peptidoglycan-binding domain-containing protein [Chloroflexota bacterium]
MCAASLVFLVSLIWPLTLRGEVAFAAHEVYVVAPGDTLSGIAKRFDLDMDTLVRVNQLRSPNLLQVGQRLILGDSAASRPLQGSHLVLAGETLSDIAQAHGVTLSDLAGLNGLGNWNMLFPGQILKVPGVKDSLPGVMTEAPVQEAAQGFVMEVPYRTQFDGTRYEESNCGPATLAMLLSYYGKWWSNDDLRNDVNVSVGYWGLDGGSDWESLVYAARLRGFVVRGLYEGPNRYRKWTIDDLLQEVQAGRPVMLLVRYRSLPGHEAGFGGDHYIVFLGLTADGRVVYNDSAFNGASEGARRTMGKDRLLQAWGRTSVNINYTAMSLEPADSQ